MWDINMRAKQISDIESQYIWYKPPWGFQKHGDNKIHVDLPGSFGETRIDSLPIFYINMQ